MGDNKRPPLSLLDYGAGNVRSVINAFKSLGHDLHIISSPDEILTSEKLVFPGVGAFGACMKGLVDRGYAEPLKQYIKSGKPFFGICIAIQTLFEESEESPGVKGLGIFPGKVARFSNEHASVPQIGWNGLNISNSSSLLNERFENELFYFVHSYYVPIDLPNSQNYICATTNYAGSSFVSALQTQNIFASQFHPEKSGRVGLALLKAFAEGTSTHAAPLPPQLKVRETKLAKRIIACLDVRSNDVGDLVVTKGDQYDVREKTKGENGERGDVRNMGKPVHLAERYYQEGADEITFLNITSFRNCPLRDMPVIELLKRTSETVYVPLTIGGGIRDLTDSEGKTYTALEVASEYFRSGADKVSIGGDSVTAAEQYYANEKKLSGSSSIEQIAYVYGRQAVVVSVDPTRVYINSPQDTKHHSIQHREPGPNGEKYCWYQCTSKGGREKHDMDVKQLILAVEALGAGELLLNCINKDGTNSGYDIDLIKDVKSYARVPVIASSGAGSTKHFEQLFEECPSVDAALAAGIFHRNEVTIAAVKSTLADHKEIAVRVLGENF